MTPYGKQERLMNNSSVPSALLSALARLPGFVRTAQADSIIQFTEATRITPTTTIDSSLVMVPELPDALQILASIYAGYTLLGAQLSVNSIDGVRVLNILDKLRPNRSVLNAASGGASKIGGLLARESASYSLPKNGAPIKTLAKPKLGTESYDDKKTPRKDTGTYGGLGKDAVSSLSQDSNLAVGKTLELNVTSEGRQFSIPITVRLNTLTMKPQEMVDVVTNINPHMTSQEVKDLYMSGEIDLWDALTGKTAAEQWRKAAMNDKTGMILAERNRKSRNTLASALSGELTVANISGVYVVSGQTAKQIEAEIGGKLSNFQVREKLLKETSVMLLAVLDTEWKSITIYHHSIDGQTKYSFGELKRGGKTANHDIGAVLEAFRQGQAPTKFF